MGAGTAADTANIEVGSVRVVYEYHADCTLDYAVVGIHGCIVKELVDGVEGICGVRFLMGSDFTESHQQFVVYGLCVIEVGAKHLLDSADSEFIERRDGVGLICILVFGAVVGGL